MSKTKQFRGFSHPKPRIGVKACARAAAKRRNQQRARRAVRG